MKKHLTILLAAVLLIPLFAAKPAAAQTGKLSVLVNKMKDVVCQPISKWQMSDTLSEAEVMDPNTPAKKFKKVGIGHFWTMGSQTIWLRNMYTVPEKILNIPVAGTRIGMRANIEESGSIYVNGEHRQDFHRSDGYVVLTGKAKPGERFFIVIRAKRKGTDTGLIRDISLDYSALKEIERRAGGFSEAVGSLDMLLELSGEKLEKWAPLIDQAVAALDMAALEDGRPDVFFASLKHCTDILTPLSKIIQKYSMLMVGYSHIDPAWLWHKAEGEHIVVAGTSQGILDAMKDFPDFVYVMNQMHCYRWMEQDYPGIFDAIKQKMKIGKWEAVGAEWVEPDGNLPAGESYVRQFFYGRKYSKEKFGMVSNVGFTPDSFGYNWSMPQILSKSDMRGFVTQKISWNDTTRFPHHIFWWEAPDGSKVLVYFPMGGYGENVNAGVMAQQLVNMKQQYDVDENLVIFGIGDHGGGIPRDYLERAYALRDNPLYPKIEFTTVEKVFDRLFKQAKTRDFPTWDDELYLQYHRGTYTTQSNTKNNNRRNELRLMNAERFSSIASIATGLAYPARKIEDAWKIMLFNQFHDILPGSSITPVYRDADRDHAWVAQQTGEVTHNAMESLGAQADTTGAGTPVLLFNGMSWNRDDVVEVPIGQGIVDAAVFDEAGREIPVQIVEKNERDRFAVFVARNLPALGFSVYRLREWVKPAAVGGPLSAKDNVMENEFFRVAVDPASGWVSSIFDKKNNREIIEQGKAAFQLQALQEREDSDAWDPRYKPDGTGIIPPESATLPMPNADEIKIVESGPVRVTIMSHVKFGQSEFNQYISLVEGVPIVYARLDADWHETNVFLKSAFNLNLDGDYATYEIPYATIKRTTKPKTPAEMAEWEVSGHRWVDYTANDKTYGVTLLSFQKYGYDIKNSRMRMSMLRSPTGPDPEADRGKNSIPYALYPHAGDWPAADSSHRGAEYNDPALVFVLKDHHPGKLGKRHSFFSATPANAVVTTIKKSDDGKGFVIRLVETQGKDTTAVLTLPAKPKQVTETNLVERELKKLATPKGNTLSVPLGHYEIKTLKVVF